MGIFDWIPNPMVRKSGQTSRDRAVEIVYVGTEKVDLRSKIFSGGILRRCFSLMTIGDIACE